MMILAVTSVSSDFCHASTCFRMGSKLRCIRSTPTEIASTRENAFECFASTGVKSPLNAMFEQTKTRYYAQDMRGSRILSPFPVHLLIIIESSRAVSPYCSTEELSPCHDALSRLNGGCLGSRLC